eukprot:TRINITY_DN1622_c0_g2_i1.p1 TRINITY_DN1622_c0_g2~~TRINITY_DN1622_c0_g2_i1.p1  ORF type:complete len:413 (+),score=76.81 TRINITY_DN1622_c0_g2_i1:61-1299(+)
MATEWVCQVAEHASSADGDIVALLFDFSRISSQTRASLANDITNNEKKITTTASRLLSNLSPWDSLCVNHLKALAASEEKNYSLALKRETETADVFYEMIGSDRESNWWLPALNSVIRLLRFASYRADEERTSKGEKHKYMIDAQDTLKKFFQRMIIDRSPLQVSKKWGCLFLIVHLFKIYFRINNLRLCSNLITIVNNANFPKLALFPKAQTVAYNYYLGRLMIFEEQYKKAESCLEYAFSHCHKRLIANKRRILQYLVPVKLLSGNFPLTQLLKKYQLMQFDGLIQAIRSGNLKSFNECLEKHQEFFIRKGVFLVLEKLKTTVYRNLFKKVYKYVQNDSSQTKKNQLTLPLIQTALSMNGTQMDLEELECIIANLIYHNSIKGYIAHKRCIVLSKTDPFPDPHAKPSSSS